MKVTEHVELLLRQGHKPRELIQLGFSKNVVSRVRRKLKMEKAAEEIKVPAERVREDAHAQWSVSANSDMTQVLQKLESYESCYQELKERVNDLEACLKDTPTLGMRKRFKCDCGASGFIAIHVQCTKCGKEAWWGWFPR